MVDASFHVTNSAKQREFRIQKLNISLNDLMIDQHPGKDIISHLNMLIFPSGNLQGFAEEVP